MGAERMPRARPHRRALLRLSLTHLHLAFVCRIAVTSVLAIGGIGGLAIGLAGREICENLLNGFLIMSTVGA